MPTVYLCRSHLNPTKKSVPCLVETCITRRFVNRLGFFRSQNVHSFLNSVSQLHCSRNCFGLLRRHYIDPIKTLRSLMAPSAGSTCEQVIFYWLGSVPLFFSLSRNVAMYAIYFKVTFSTQLKTRTTLWEIPELLELVYLRAFKQELPFKKKFLCLHLFVSLELIYFRPCVNPKANYSSRTVEHCGWHILGIWLDT